MGKYSKHGYKRKSSDKNKPFLEINSNNITMDGVDFPVLGIDNLGNTKVMLPGTHYTFPGNTVFEVPLSSSNSAKAQNGVEVPERQGVRKNEDGSHSTHLMAHEFIEGIGWVVFPTLFQVENEEGQMQWVDMTMEKWIKEGNLPENYDWRKAYTFATQQNEVQEFGFGEEAARQAEEHAKGSWKKKREEGGEEKGDEKNKEYQYQAIIYIDPNDPDFFSTDYERMIPTLNERYGEGNYKLVELPQRVYNPEYLALETEISKYPGISKRNDLHHQIDMKREEIKHIQALRQELNESLGYSDYDKERWTTDIPFNEQRYNYTQIAWGKTNNAKATEGNWINKHVVEFKNAKGEKIEGIVPIRDASIENLAKDAEKRRREEAEKRQSDVMITLDKLGFIDQYREEKEHYFSLMDVARWLKEHNDEYVADISKDNKKNDPAFRKDPEAIASHLKGIFQSKGNYKEKDFQFVSKKIGSGNNTRWIRMSDEVIEASDKDIEEAGEKVKEKLNLMMEEDKI